MRKIIKISFGAIFFLLFLLASCHWQSIYENKTGSSLAKQDDVATSDDRESAENDEKECNENMKEQTNTTVHYFDQDIRFLYVLQSVYFSDLLDTDFDMAVIDCDDSRLKKSEVAAIKRQDKYLISYLSIGEAEDYRDYWQDIWISNESGLIDEENPNWPGNYKVRYWRNQWKNIVFERLRYIQDKGYDGVYLDVIDAYRYFQDKGYENAGKEMTKLVIEISKESKKTDKDFLIIVQNAEELLINKDYLDAIDGIGRESLWFRMDKAIDEERMDEVLSHLKIASDAGKFIIAVNYLEDEQNIKIFAELCEEHGFISFNGSVLLDKIK